MSTTAATKVYAVTMRAAAEMVVWVEATNISDARKMAFAGDYDHMTDWEPVSGRTVRKVERGQLPEQGS